MSPPLADIHDRRAVKARVSASGSTFYWAMRALARPQREAMFALYALCRVLDDIADGEAPGAEKLSQLEGWRCEAAAALDGRPATAIGRALADANRRYRLEGEEIDALIDAMRIDAEGGLVAPPAEDLDAYCRGAAGTVGVLSLDIFGRRDEPARRFGLALADALQRTNILRDLTEDAARDRLYVSEESLKAAGVSARTPEAVLADPAMGRLFDDLSQDAERRFAEAARLLADTRPDGLRPARAMMAVYGELLRRLKARGWRPGRPRLRLGRRRAAWIVLRQFAPHQR